MSSPSLRRATTQSEPKRLSHVFWLLASPEAVSELRDPEHVVCHWLSAVDGLQGRRGDPDTAQHALSFLMRLESDAFYASPEQTRGGDKDSQGLVYTLALLLFERLTGHHPFVESLSPLECRIQRDRAKRVGKNNLCYLPGALRHILHRALSPFPQDRYADVAAMRSDLEAWQGSKAAAPVFAAGSANEPSPASQARPQARAQARRPASLPPPPPPPGARFRGVDTLSAAVSVSSAVIDEPEAHALPWLWPSLCGGFAIAAAIAMLVALRSPSGQEHRTPSVAAATAVPTATRAPSPEPLPAKAQAEARDSADSADSEHIIDTELVIDATPTEPADEQTVSVVRECVPKDTLREGLSLGVSLLFDKDGAVRRSFTGRLPLAPTQARCLKEGMDLVITTDDDQVGKMITFDLYVSPANHRVRSRPAKR